MTEYSYFVVMPDGADAEVSRHSLWTDALDAVHEIAYDGGQLAFVHHIHDGVVDVKTQEALDETRNFLFENMRPLTERQLDFVENMYGLEVAFSFRGAA